MFTTRLKTHHSAMAAGREYALGPRPVRVVLTGEGKQNSTIYIHVPFCAKICTFCNMRRSLQAPVEDYHEWIMAPTGVSLGKVPSVILSSAKEIYASHELS